MARHGHPRGEQGQAGGVDVEDGAADQAENGDDGERHQEPRGQECGQRADRVGRDLPAQVRGGTGQQKAEDQQEERGHTGAEGGPADHAQAGGTARQIAGVVGGGVHPAETEAGHHEHQRTDELLRGARRDGIDRAPVDVVGHQGGVDDGEHARDHRDSRLQTHDQVETHDPADDGQRGHQHEGHDLGPRAAAPAQPAEDGRGGQGGERGEDRLPADGEDPRDHRRQPVAAHAVGGPAEHHRGRRTALSGDCDEAAQEEGDDDAEHAGGEGLPEGDAEAQGEGAVTEAEDGDVRPEPGPEQGAWGAFALRVPDHVETVRLPWGRAAGGGALGPFLRMRHRRPVRPACPARLSCPAACPDVPGRG